MYNLQKQGPATYLLPKQEWMHVPGLVISSEKLLSDPEIEKPLERVANVATLQGIVGHSITMPDMHWGYGFPIGGVAAMDAETGVISPGGVGYDINCGVRLAILPIDYATITLQQKQKLLDKLFQKVPSGVGQGHKSKKLQEGDYQALITKGAAWSIEKGYGLSQDLEYTESHGVIEGADPAAVSELAKHRGSAQLGSIGSGNHFVEVGHVEKIYLPEIAQSWGVQKGLTHVLIHSGSRGFGHQVCQDTSDEFISLGYAKDLRDKQLVAAPIKSSASQSYFAAMAAAANFAFNNRQQILHYVRECFAEVFKPVIESFYMMCVIILRNLKHMLTKKCACIAKAPHVLLVLAIRSSIPFSN